MTTGNLSALFESLDEKVFTPELKKALEAQFNEAVEVKAKSMAEPIAESMAEAMAEAKAEVMAEAMAEAKAEVIAEAKIEEEIDSLNEKAEQHIEFLNKKADEYIATKQAEMVESLDKYLERVVDKFVADTKDLLAESVKSEKADMIIEAFDAMLVATGIQVSQIVEAKDETAIDAKLAESNAKYDALVEENIALSEENKKLIKMGVISELKEGLSLVEAEKFEKLAELVEFSKSGEFLTKLTTIKESVKGTADIKGEKLKVADLTEEHAKPPIWAHLV